MGAIAVAHPEPPLSSSHSLFSERHHESPRSSSRDAMKPLPRPGTGIIREPESQRSAWPLHRLPRASSSASTPGSGRASSSRSTGASGARSSTGSSAPGTRLPSSRALAADLGVSRTTTLLAVQQLQAEGYLTARRGSGTSVAARAAGRPRGAERRTLRRRADGIPRCPAGGPRWRRCEEGARRLDGPPRAFRLGTPAVDLFPVALWSRLASRRLRLGHGGPARLRRSGGPPGPARGHREPRPDGAGHAVRGRPGGHGGRRPAGLRARLPAAAGSGRPRVDGGARLSRSAERAPGGGRADRPGARRCRGPGRRPGSPPGGRRPPRLRDAVAPVPARRADEPADGGSRC